MKYLFVSMSLSKMTLDNSSTHCRYIPDSAVKTNFGPFARYYVQQDLDDGYYLKTSIPVDQVGKAKFFFCIQLNNDFVYSITEIA